MRLLHFASPKKRRTCTGSERSLGLCEVFINWNNFCRLVLRVLLSLEHIFVAAWSTHLMRMVHVKISGALFQFQLDVATEDNWVWRSAPASPISCIVAYFALRRLPFALQISNRNTEKAPSFTITNKALLTSPFCVVQDVRKTR